MTPSAPSSRAGIEACWTNATLKLWLGSFFSLFLREPLSAFNKIPPAAAMRITPKESFLIVSIMRVLKNRKDR